MERFGDAYAAQLENFAQNVLQHRDPPVTVDDGVQALRVAIAATQAVGGEFPIVSRKDARDRTE